METHYLVAYDICDAKRRRRLLKVLEDYAYRIQFSVFEMCVDDWALAKITKWIDYVIDKDEDSVIIFELNASAIKNRRQFGVERVEEKMYKRKYLVL